MAPQKKNTPTLGVIHEPNNIVAFTRVEAGVPEEFHPLMKFLSSSNLNYCLHEAPTIQCELMEEFWASAEYKESANEISFIFKGKTYTITTTALGEVLMLPQNNISAIALDEDVIQMLKDTNYALTPSSVKLGEVVRRNYRREWSYFFDSIIKVFSGKVSNFDAFTTSKQFDCPQFII